MKKGNLNLSINSIVVLILAITMLGLGLAFMRNIFGDATSSFDDVTAEMQTEMTQKLRDTRDNVVLNVRETRAEMRSTSTIYLGINNDRSSTVNFEFEIHEDGTSCDLDDNNNGCSVNFQVFADGTIQGRDVEVIPINFEPEPIAEGGANMPFTIFVCTKEDSFDANHDCDQNSDSLHGIANFYVTV